MRIVIAGAFILSLTLSSVGIADTLYRVKTTIGGGTVLGVTDSEQTTESQIWIGKARFRKETPPLAVIVRFDQGLIYILDQDKRTYNEVKLPYDIRDHLPSELAQQYRLAEQLLALQVVIDETGETRKIGNWTARHCIAVMSTQGALVQKMHIWAAPDLDSTTYSQGMKAFLSLSPISLPVEKVEGACGGFPVLRESEIEAFGATVHMKEELVSVEERQVTKDFYAPPPGFRKEKLDPLQAIRSPWDERFSIPGLSNDGEEVP